ncbi:MULTISPECIES: L-fucose isomerase [unclassified Corynebacterium]|uniref:L-fucose isomerase n=1 Tax=unclassified Corynebacterium TaxID=2624378 RepID=UPI001C471CCC|nr:MULTISPECIES: L-fucose isomerase [unclassified Corynebacterium]MBV7281276.1 L-fucose isomerase [Corynebacterium sp. TAE3-ERU30]MBV7301846.1 L-fucose isomerase [Corynebacterium sp. TAE3-ERU2]
MVHHPKIGIRPTIDGRRRGVRESLEDKTMWMAHAAADLITKNLRYLDGEPVEVVIAETTIGRPGEAAACDDLFAGQNVIAELTVTPAWCYVTETMDMDPNRFHAIWGYNGTERPGAVTLAANLAAYAQYGIPAFSIYGHDVQDADDTDIPEEVSDKILTFSRAAVAAGQMRGKGYLQMGSTCMGIAGSSIDRHFFQDYLGMRVESVDMTEFIRRINEGIFDPEEYEKARAWVRENVQIGKDFNPEPRDDAEEQWDFITKMALIGRDMMEGNPKLAELGFEEEACGFNAIASGFQGQRQWTDTYPNGDFMETMLNTTFDWNGARRPVVLATENDTLNGASMLLNYLLTNRTQMFSDVRTYWSPEAIERVTGEKPTGGAANGFLDLRNSGATTLDATGVMKDAEGNPCTKPFWEVTEEDQKAVMEATTFHAATHEYFRGGGFSTHFRTAPNMPVTMIRLNLIKGVGPVLQIAEGETVTLSEEATTKIENRTDRTWPTTFFAPRLTGKGAFTSVYDVMDNWGANHGAIGFGHFGKELITLAAMLRIPVNMHNVDDAEIFRPRAWGLHGTADKESADFRACENYGPFFA